VDKPNQLPLNLRFLRMQKAISQAETARGLGFSKTKYNNYESGVSKPGLDDFVKISAFFGVPGDDILHKDLSAGNLILHGDGAKTHEDGKVISKESGNLLAFLSAKMEDHGSLPGAPV